MGFDLAAKNGTWMRYNISGWRALHKMVEEVDFPTLNEGELISASDCKVVAEVIEKNAVEYNDEFGGLPKEKGGYGEAPAAEHAKWWRDSGGAEVW